MLVLALLATPTALPAITHPPTAPLAQGVSIPLALHAHRAQHIAWSAIALTFAMIARLALI
jgi:hypothetical protein